MVKWRNEDNYECKGTQAAHRQAIEETRREASLDPVAKVRGASKEAERRKQSAVNQNRLATKFGDSDDSDKEKGTAAKSESSEKTKVKKGFLTRQESPKKNRKARPKQKHQKAAHGATAHPQTEGKPDQAQEWI